MENFDYIRKNLTDLENELCEIAERAGVPVPKLVAVTKSATDEELLALVKYGASAIGENRPQLLRARSELLIKEGLSPEFHQIGQLQSNKAKMVCDRTALIHSLDSLKLAGEINKQGERMSRKIPVLIEINSAREPQKGGVFPEDAERFLTEVLKLDFVLPKGLMTMGPPTDNGEELREYFRLTKKLFDKLNTAYGFGAGATLSMGMSDSYRVAVEEGSTLVRVGRRLFVKNQEDK